MAAIGAPALAISGIALGEELTILIGIASEIAAVTYPFANVPGERPI